MIRLLSFKIAYKFSMCLFLLFLLFHIFIIIGVEFWDLKLEGYLWGGRLQNKAALIQFELISVLIQTLFIILLYFRIRINKLLKYKVIINFFIWILCILFAFNTIGNLFAYSLYEKIIFTPITLALTVFMLRIAVEKDI